MKRSIWITPLLTCGATVALFGCNGGTFEELQKAPVSFQQSTAKPRSQVADCVVASLSRFGSDLGNFPDIEQGLTRLTLGGNDGYAYRNYYQIDITDQARGARIAVRHSKAKDGQLSETDLHDIVIGCAK
ncbi:hypothetical protein WM40_03455 [Robbsia andropogonis]|uniref:Lipoprotein n=1 Tax=Robbsia andropogonis TaxID=28092 RepID=A0A0F5K4H8_9BURK|nr:hypothetical protein [Robbsia andropogonis]KKB65011.1 hypothetical protein WM40_03455 [Robbsia andropogonis]MCP1118577.1 hypothetical protein [Robbsia andropogonis]MCP1128044.1 hypothetical protein [Robbsia andropogonis]